MRYMQIRLTEEEFILVKKAALDAKVSLEAFLKAAVFEKMFLDIVKKEADESLQNSTGGSKNG